MNFNELDKHKIGLGTWQWGDKLTWGYGNGYQEDDLKFIFNGSIELGCTFFDTAEVYGSGKSERLLGEMIKETGNKPFIASKFFPYPWRFTVSSFVNAVRQSLKRLQIDQIDLYQIHWPNPVIPFDLYARGFKAAKEEGLINLIGVSNFNQNRMMAAINSLDHYGLSLASNQVEYNLINRSIEWNGLLNRCQELGIKVIAYSPLAMGFLSGKYNSQNHSNSYRDARYNHLIKKLQPLIAIMTEIGHQNGGKSSSQVAINWCKHKNTLPIPGAKTAIQAESNVSAVSWDLTIEEIKLLDDASEKVV